MYKIAISGKLNSGKNTVAKFLSKYFKKKLGENNFKTKIVAFADPIKQIAMLMFPNTEKKYWFGSSKLREEYIPFLNKKNLTYRKILLNLGKLGRSYNENLWLDILFSNIVKYNSKYNLLIVSDVRFKNEFDALNKNGFITIRICGKSDIDKLSTDISEIEQDNIKDNQFNFVINNKSSLKDLEYKVNLMVNKIIAKNTFDF